MDSLVSVLMPAFNAEAYVLAAIASVREQTFSAWELIIVDDGSTDATGRIAEEAASQDRRIRLIHQRNAGQGAARNRALAASQGSLIAFLDADDLWLPAKLGLQVGTIEREGVDVVFSDGFVFPDNDVNDETRSFSTASGRIPGEEMLQRLLLANQIPIQSFLGRRRAIVDVSGFDESRSVRGCEDYDLYCRLARDGRSFFGLTQKLVRYRRHLSQTSRNALLMLRSELTVVEKHWANVTRSEPVARLRVADLRRRLIEGVLQDGDVAEARRQLLAIRKADPWRFSLYLQLGLLPLSPKLFQWWTERGSHSKALWPQ